MIRNRIENFIKKYNLSGTFIIAFSGGYDSMCLLDILYKLNLNIVAVHLNHNWRGEESKKEAQNCENFAKSRNIPYYSEVLPDTVEKTETAAREARYDFFQRCAKKFNTNIVFTAHNFDDNAETILYRIIKGTGTIGLQGISEHRDIYYRPLLKTQRCEIEKYIKENNLSPNVDSSNFNSKYKRNLIRHEIFPILKKINPKVTQALNSLSELAIEDNELINTYIPKNLIKTSYKEQKRLIYKLLAENNIEYDRKKIENIQKFIEENKNSKSGKKISVSTNLWLFVNNSKAELITKEEKKNTQIQIQKCGKYKFEDYEFSIEPFSGQLSKYPSDKDFKAYINIENIDFILRHRENGDKIQPLGLSGSQKLKKYLNEKKIPAHEKDKLIFLCRNNEILWAPGLGISEKIKVVNTPTHVLTLKRG